MIELNTIHNEDCLKTMAKMRDGEVDIVVTSPPFNVGKDYGETSDDNRADYDIWISEVLNECERVASTAVYVFISQRKMEIVKRALQGFQQWLFWHRPNLVSAGGRITFPWTPTITPIAMSWTNGRKPMLNEAYGVRTFDLMIAASPQSNFHGELHRVHITQDPITPYWTVIVRTPGRIIYDPFLGSGTSALAAIKAGREWVASEINPEYCAIARKRVEQTFKPDKIFQETIQSDRHE